MIRTTWNPVVRNLIETLTCRVRALSCHQIREGWFPERTNVVEQELEHLIDSDLLLHDDWTATQLSVGDRPLSQWSPGQPRPDLEALVPVLRDRWTGPTMRMSVYAASPIAARLFGSSAGRLPPVHHRNHDLLLSAVYLRYRLTQPDIARHWLGEDALPLAERGVKNPDAFLIDSHGRIVRVVESVGRYSLDQLQSFHEYCRQSELPYELW